MKQEERKNRVIARGEGSNHSHVAVGDCAVIRNIDGEILLEVGNEGAVLKHILESDWLQGKETWTNEHADIKLDKGTYKYIPQVEYHPYNKVIQEVKD